MRSKSICILLFCSIISLARVEAEGKSLKDWTNRLIPLPKQIQIKGARSVFPSDVRLTTPGTQEALITSALEILRPLAAGGRGFDIRLTLTSDPGTVCPPNLRKSLEGLPNHDQAYAFEPLLEGRKFKGLLLAANTQVGLLYAARTLSQLVQAPSGPGKMEEFPQVTLLDWPDLSERGEWGGNAAQDLKWMAERKFNVVELHANLGFDEKNLPKASLDEAMLREAAQSGIKVVPIILHLEQLASTGLFRFYPQVAATPDPGKPLPTDYEPSVCFSETQTSELLSGWMERLLEIPGVNEVMVWLSETKAQCYCSRCKRKDPFVMEVQGIQRAFDKAHQRRPKAVLRILTTQASYDVNDKVLANAAADTRITYYDGGRTYDSSRRPMIYPLLETFARSGRWLGVYPQLTNSWRTVFPFTGPQFLHARMKEFVEKQLSCLVGYATPSNRYYEFNITAAAEWSWNSRGRSPREFAEAYAARIGILHPDQFAEWAELIGDVGWDLAGSRVVEGLIFNPGRTLSERKDQTDTNLLNELPEMKFGEGLFSEFPSQKHFADKLALAKQALKLAESKGNPRMVDESRCVVGALGLLEGLRAFSETKKLPELQRVAAVQSALAQIDQATRILTISLHRWGMAVNPVSRNSLPSRFRDTVDLASRVASIAWQMGKSLPIQDPYPAYRLQALREWSTEDFSAGDQATLWTDVTDLLHQGGEYDVTFQFLEGDVGLDIHSVVLLRGATREVAQPVDEERWNFHVGRWDRWTEYWISAPTEVKSSEKAGDRYFLKMEVSRPGAGAGADRHSTHGRILFRKSWRGEKL